MPKIKDKPEHFKMGAAHRLKIKNSNILNALIRHVEGDLEMTSTQVTAGLGLLKKVMPDLTHNETDMNITVSDLDAVAQEIRSRGVTIHNYDASTAAPINAPKPH